MHCRGGEARGIDDLLGVAAFVSASGTRVVYADVDSLLPSRRPRIRPTVALNAHLSWRAPS